MSDIEQCEHKIDQIEVPILFLYAAIEAGMLTLPCCLCGKSLNMKEIWEIIK